MNFRKDILLITLSVLGILIVLLSAPSVMEVFSRHDVFSRIYEVEEIAKPKTYRNLAPNTPITEIVEVRPYKYSNIYVKTVYSKLKLYADEELIYTCGEEGSYLEALMDPPTLISIVPLPETAVKLRFEYISPSQRTTMVIPPVIGGKGLALMNYLLLQNGALLILSITMILLGTALIVVALISLKRLAILYHYIHLGSFALLLGSWGLGECNATAFFIPYPSILHLMTYIGFISFVIPLLQYGIDVLKPRHRWPIQGMIAVLSGVLLISVVLQFTGITAMHAWLKLYQLLNGLAALILGLTTIIERFLYKNPIAKRFSRPFGILFCGALLEYWNYTARFTQILSMFLMASALLFTIFLGSIGMVIVREKFREIEESRRAVEKLHFYRKMSHDLRTPLTRISTNIQIANLSGQTDHQRLGKSQEEIMRISEMIDAALTEGRGEHEDGAFGGR